MLDVATELDLALVPGFESELRCESKHRMNTCSGEVTCRYSYSCEDGGAELLGCQNCYLFILDAWKNYDYCRKCKKDLRECWKVVPV